MENKIKKSLGLQIFSFILSGINFILFVPTALFTTLLIIKHGKLYYVVLFVIASLVLIIAALIFLLIGLSIYKNNKNLDLLAKNGIKVTKVEEPSQDDKKQEDLGDFAKTIDSPIITPVTEEIKPTLAVENKENNDIEVTILDNHSKEHKVEYKYFDNTNDTFKEFLNNGGIIEDEVLDYYSKIIECNQKKREQSIKNENALSHILREININDCIINNNFLRYDVLTLNMDYIEEVTNNDCVLNFMLFDIKYNLVFNTQNEVKAFLSYLKQNKQK